MSDRNTAYGNFGTMIGAVEYIQPVIGLAATQRVDEVINPSVQKNIGRYQAGGYDAAAVVALPDVVTVSDSSVSKVNQEYHLMSAERYLSGDEGVILFADAPINGTQRWWFQENVSGPMLVSRKYFWSEEAGEVPGAPPHGGWNANENDSVVPPVPEVNYQVEPTYDPPPSEPDPVV